MIKHLKFILFYPKIGPDMYLTHWLLFFKPFRIWFQKIKMGPMGENSEIRPYSTIIGTKNIVIGNNVIIPGGTTLGTMPGNENSRIIIENDVLLGPNVSIYASTHNFSDPTKPIKTQGYNVGVTVIKEGSWIGVNAVILPEVTIGKNSVVAANAVVTKDVPDFSIVAGVPAIIIKEIYNV